VRRFLPRWLTSTLGAILTITGILGLPRVADDLVTWSGYFEWPYIYMPLDKLPGFVIYLLLITGILLITSDTWHWIHAWLNRDKRFYSIQDKLLFGGIDSKRKGTVTVDPYPYCFKHLHHQFVSYPTQMRHQLDLRCPRDGCPQKVFIFYQDLEAMKEAVKQNRLAKMSRHA